ncbi:MAG: hypothetical protein MMC33_005902 [Icmadophila ericetorum]|nr:hypothetical protein [Icmadophila ericetorum]
MPLLSKSDSAAPNTQILPLQAQVQRPTAPDAPDSRYQINQKCIYERPLPGGAYMTAHVERLQPATYSSSDVSTIPSTTDEVYFLAVGFVLHPADAENHRFKSAEIAMSVENTNPRAIPTKFLKHAPHLIYGAVSPETLQWTFNLTGSLGISQAPVNASLNPSVGLSESSTIYKMMKIQGSTRTVKNRYTGQMIEDGKVVWTLEENMVQKSGLPREFTFVLLIQRPPRGRGHNSLHFHLDFKPVISSWFGSYPSSILKLKCYRPLAKQPLNLKEPIGQTFTANSTSPLDSYLYDDDYKGSHSGDSGYSTPIKNPSSPVRKISSPVRKVGSPVKQRPVTWDTFNFADMKGNFEDLVEMPGTTYSIKDPIGPSGPGSGPSVPAGQ